MILDAYGDSGICRQNGKFRAKTGPKRKDLYVFWGELVCDKRPEGTHRIDIDVCYPHKADIRRVVAKRLLLTLSGHSLEYAARPPTS